MHCIVTSFCNAKATKEDYRIRLNEMYTKMAVEVEVSTKINLNSWTMV